MTGFMLSDSASVEGRHGKDWTPGPETVGISWYDFSCRALSKREVPVKLNLQCPQAEITFLKQ